MGTGNRRGEGPLGNGPAEGPRGRPAAEALDGLALVDHHCHGVVGSLTDQASFELLVNEGFDPAPPGTSHLEAPVWLAVRRWCAPVLDLPPLSPPATYLERRFELGSEEVNRRLLRAAGLAALYVDGGHRSGEVLDLDAMGELAGTVARPVVRVETVAEALVEEGGLTASSFPVRFREALAEASEGVVGLKSVVAYRGGFDLDPEPPSRAEVVAAAGRWLRDVAAGRRGSRRLDDPVLLRHGLWTAAALAAERGLPIQLHAGFGDPDLTLHLADPSMATWFVRGAGRLGVDVVFLHCYPYHREAACLAAVLPNAYFDVGLALNYVGPSAASLMAEAMELAPFAKQLYSSDAFGLPELYLAGAMQFREALGAVLDGWVAEERCTPNEAKRTAAMIGRDNALRIYPG